MSKGHYRTTFCWRGPDDRLLAGLAPRALRGCRPAGRQCLRGDASATAPKLPAPSAEQAYTWPLRFGPGVQTGSKIRPLLTTGALARRPRGWWTQPGCCAAPPAVLWNPAATCLRVARVPHPTSAPAEGGGDRRRFWNILSSQVPFWQGRESGERVRHLREGVHLPEHRGPCTPPQRPGQVGLGHCRS